MRPVKCRTILVLVASLVAGCGDRSSGTGGDPGPAVAESATVAAMEAAEQYLADGDPAAAETVAARLAERLPRDPRARELLGRVLLSRAIGLEQAGSPDAAVLYARAYEEYAAAADGAGPHAAGLHHSAGTLAMQIGRPTVALEHYTRAGEADPLDARAPLFAAQILIEQERFDAADRSLLRVLALDPDQPQALASRAVIAMHRGAYEDALDRVRAAREIDPRDLAIRVIEARIQRAAGEPAEALRLLVALPEPQRVSRPMTSEIAAAWSALGRHDRAAEAWALRHRREPDAPEIWRAAVEAGTSYARSGAWRDAAAWLAEAKIAAPDAPEVAELEERVRGRDRGIEGSRDPGIEGSRDRGIQGSRDPGRE
jgi:tetratricopeptide (TPR) repeat protein